jgi:hypothetical protein
MTNKILAVCTSVGDTQGIIFSAKELACKKIKSDILVVGEAAQKKMKESHLSDLEKEYITFLDLDEILNKTSPIANKILKLSKEDIKDIEKSIFIKDYDGLLVGTPSYTKVDEQSEIPEQLLRLFAPYLPSAVVSDYGFYDKDHHVNTRRWFNIADKLLVPFGKAIEVMKTNILKAIPVGHPSIDDMREKFVSWIKERNDEKNDTNIHATREKLGIETDQKFIFVAGGKADDEEMVKALLNTCQKFPKIKIRMGVHPAADSAYLEKLNKMIDDAKCNKQFTILEKGVITTDEAVYASNGVLTVSSTVGTAAAACTKPVGFYQPGKKLIDDSLPYAIGEYNNAGLYTNEEDLLLFFKKVKETTEEIPLKDLVGSGKAAENIANEVQKLITDGLEIDGLEGNGRRNSPYILN